MDTGGEHRRHLILVKHSLTAVDPGLPASQWRLGAEGRRRCPGLAERLARYRPASIYASVEPKAAETALLVARHLGVPWQTWPGLHEHDRGTVGYLDNAEFQAAVARLFAHPDELVFGSETAAAAQSRFIRAVQAALTDQPRGSVAIVAHGTVIALFVQACADIEPLPLWRRLGLPSFLVLAAPDLALIAIEDRIE